MTISLSATYNEKQFANHSFNTHLATLLKSVDQAIFINHISYWIEYNSRMKKNFYEGKYWTFQTLEELAGHFPYWSIKQVRLVIDKLCKAGILLKGNFNKNIHDRTNWYTIDYEVLSSICPFGQMVMPKRANGDAQTDKCNNTNNITHNKTNKREAKPLARSLFGSHVKLYQEEYVKLSNEYGKEKLDEMIEKINRGIDSKGYKYKSFEATIRNWFDKEKEFTKNSNPKAGSIQNNIEWVKKNLKDGMIYKNSYNPNGHGYKCTITTEGVYFDGGGASYKTFKYSDHGFKEQITNLLR